MVRDNYKIKSDANEPLPDIGCTEIVVREKTPFWTVRRNIHEKHEMTFGTVPDRTTNNLDIVDKSQLCVVYEKI